MPNLIPTLIATTSRFGKTKPVSRVMLNPVDAALLKEGELFTRVISKPSLIESSVGVLNGSILVLQWKLIPQGQVSILEGDDIGLCGALEYLIPDPHYIVPIAYGVEPLYELDEEVVVTKNSKEGSWGPIYGVLNVNIHNEIRLSSLRTHHLNVIEGPMPPDILLQLPGIHYWINSVDIWIPEDCINPATTQSSSQAGEQQAP